MAFLCPVRIRRGKKKKSSSGDSDKELSRPGSGLSPGMGRITGSASIETLVRVGIEKEHGLSPDSKMVVLHDFAPCVDDELEVKRGQIVNVLYRENDWVYVILADSRREGFIPHSYCAPCEHHDLKKKLPRSRSPADIAHRDVSQLSVSDGVTNDGTSEIGSEGEACPFSKDPSGRYVVLYTFTARDENDVHVERGEFVTVLNREDPDWYWIVRSDGQEGFIPSGFVYPAVVQPAQPDSTQTALPQPPAISLNNTMNNSASQDADGRYHGTELVMLYDYKAQAPDDLSVKRGEWVYADLTQQTVEGWLWAHAPKSRRSGFIPTAYARAPHTTSLLRTGWCAARSEPPLSASEREAIAAVVKRAEKLDEVEAKRVGRLVARLDGMRRSANGPAPRSCLLCGDTSRLLSPLRTCSICRNTACSKCVIDTPPHRVYSRESYMCNLCAETREMWKKSGAWFYKSVPKYILPERRITGRYYDTELARSLQVRQDAAGNSSNEGNTDTEPGSPLSVHAPSFSRQPSNTDSKKLVGSPHEWNETDILTHGFSGLSLHRQDSLTQRPLGALKRTGSKGSAYSLRSVRKEAKPTQVERAPAIPDAGFGTLEIRLAYDNPTSSLAVTVLRARGLIGMDMTGLSDPFCRLEVLPREGSYSNRMRTKTVHKTKNPEYNETLHFFGLTESDLAAKSLEIFVFDDDRYGCDEMGSAVVALRECAKSPTQLRLALSGSTNIEPVGPRILLALCYSTKRRALVVTVCKGAELPAQDSNGYSDPFVKIHLDPDPYHKKHKTSIKWRNLNPVWNEEFLFETRPTELSRQNLTLTVWDKDYGKPNDFLGSLVLGASSKGRRLKHWMDCIKFPDHKHEQWHSLTDTQHL